MTKVESVSLVLLTMNRSEAVERSLRHNLFHAGHAIHEIVHVDNGSDIGFCDWFCNRFGLPAVQIRNAHNLGVAKGYNRGLSLATSSHIVITGCDRMMPDLWLKKMIQAANAIPNTGAISVYSKSRIEDKTIRFRGPKETINGIDIIPAMVCEARMHSREFLLGAGYLREDFGLYGHEDCEWIDRTQRYSQENGLINYVLADLPWAEHLETGNEGQYLVQKQNENHDKRKPKLVQWCNENGNPYYNPYFQIEENRLGKV